MVINNTKSVLIVQEFSTVIALTTNNASALTELARAFA